MLARHLGKYIPGNPTLIVQNMPGAGGLTSSNWFEDLAKPDGLTLYYCVGSTAVTQQAFGAEGVKFNLRRWEMLEPRFERLRGSNSGPTNWTD